MSGAWAYINRIKNRMNVLNKNWLAIICGETGSGKSYSALSLGAFIGKVHLVFSPFEFLTLINSGKVIKGDIIIFDEAGVGMGAREWQSVQNKLLGSVLQTFRNMNCGVIFTTPNLSFIDIQARKLFHSYFETLYIDYDKEETILKPYNIEVNSRYDKIYYKKPRYTDHDGITYAIAQLSLPKPPKKIIEYYEKRKTAYTEQLNKRALEELTNKNKPKEHKHTWQINFRDKKRYCRNCGISEHFEIIGT